MTADDQSRTPYVIGPEGERLTRDKLPKPNVRWTPKRKAQVVAAVAGAIITVEEACATYNLSMEEFAEWARLIDAGGLTSLKVTQPQARNSAESRPDPTRDSTSISLTTAVPPPLERRSNPRAVSIFRVGKLTFADGEELARVRNLSAGGVAVELAAPRTVGETVSIEICEGRTAEGTIAWVQDNSAGIRFNDEIDIGLFLTRKPAMIGQVSRQPRINLTCSARVTVGKYQYVARVRDISQGGIKLEIDEEQPLGTVVMVSVDGLNARRGVVAWHRGTMIGVVFDQAIAFEELADWLAMRARGRAGPVGEAAPSTRKRGEVVELRAAG